MKEFVPINSVYLDDDTDTKKKLWLGGGKFNALSRLLDGQDEKNRIQARQGSKEDIYALWGFRGR